MGRFLSFFKFKRGGHGILHFYWRVAFQPCWKSSLTAIGLMLAAALLEMALLSLCAPLLDTAMHVEQASSKSKVVFAVTSVLYKLGMAGTPQNILMVLLLTICALVTFQGLFALWQQYKVAQIRESLRCDMKTKIFHKILGADYEFLIGQNRGSLLNDLQVPPQSLDRAIGYGGKMIAALLSSLMIIGLMLYISWVVTLTIGLLGFFWVRTWRRLTDHRSAKIGRDLYLLNSKINQIEVDAIDGLKVVKAFSLARIMASQQEAFLRAQYIPNLRIMLLASLPRVTNVILASLLVAILGTVVCTWAWVHMSFSQVVVFFIALHRLCPALATFNSSFTELYREKKGIEVIEEFLQRVPQERSVEVHPRFAKVRTLSLQNVGFYYPSKPNHWILRAVSIQMATGSVTALVGLTGAGKSTLANLLIGFYRPRAGAVLVNGLPIEQIPLVEWRSRIGYIGQDTFLFNSSVRNNITLWNSSVEQEEVEQAAKFAQIHEAILSLPNQYESVIGDRGLRLSGGQCQRLAIARAILRRPELLIFDEATSALDNLTESAVLNAIRTLRENTLILVISHRLHTIQHADQIVVLENGQVEEQGAHTELIQRQGLYAKLYKIDATTISQSATTIR